MDGVENGIGGYSGGRRHADDKPGHPNSTERRALTVRHLSLVVGAAFVMLLVGAAPPQVNHPRSSAVSQVPGQGDTAVGSEVTSKRPNVLVIVTDDQTSGTVNPIAMPRTYALMVAGGRSYPNFTVADPLCCPSRAAMMTGSYNHNNGVTSNLASATNRLPHHATVPCILHRAGYQTGLFGKFFNTFPLTSRPPCFDDWAFNLGRAHAGLPISIDGRVSRPAGYTDDVTLRHAVRFITAASHRRGPWFAWVAWTYPHSPYRPRPAHAHDQIPLPVEATGPARGEVDRSDKPGFVQAHEGPIGRNQTPIAELRMLRTVDNETGRLRGVLTSLHQLRSTMIIYVSDHGYLFGEHRLWGKSVPYTESIRAPFFVRWPGHVTAGSQDLRLVQGVDIAPTIVRAAGAHATAGHPWDGRSLLRTTWSRPYAYGESFSVRDKNPDHWQPAWRSIRSLTYQYVEWRAAGHVIAREYYDLASDPFQLQNLLGDGDHSNDPTLPPLHAALLAEARCSGHTQCR